MKKIMILGAGYTQIPLFEAAGRLGVKTVACSIKGNYDGFAYADEISYTDISDPEAVTAACREFNVDGVATCGLDLGMRAIGHACEELGLPGPSKKAALTVSDKFLMKDALVKGGVRTAKFFRVSDEEELCRAMDELRFPIMVKAVDQMGGRGIFRCDTREEALINFRESLAASRKPYCVAEEFIEGTLFGVEAMIQNGEFVFFMPDNTEVFHAAADLPVGHSVPLDNEAERYRDIKEQITLAVKAAGLDNCPVNADCIQAADGAYIVEITGRPGATGLSEIVSIKYGLDYYEEIIKLALGMDARPDFAARPFGGGILTNTLTAKREGIVHRIADFNIRTEDIIDLSFNISPGDHVQPFTNGRDRIGQVILKGPSLSDCRKKLWDISKRIHIELEGDVPLETTPVEKLYTDENGNNIYIKRDDLLSFSYGGNKVRFAYEYLNDMRKKGCDAMIIYGGYTSNLCRILSQLCMEKGIPCAMVYNTDDSDPENETLNASLIKKAGVQEFRCEKSGIAAAVQEAFDWFESKGLKAYYIHGNIYGEGNSHIPMKAAEDLFYEIKMQEDELGAHFSHIFLAGSTNATQAGLLAGEMSCDEKTAIVGISVNRNEARGKEVILKDLEEYMHHFEVSWMRRMQEIPDEIIFTDKYTCGGYGAVNEEITGLIRDIYEQYGIGLDPVYTGKAFLGMTKYLREHNIKSSDILFLHTGGTPLFLDFARGRGLL